tara:strand:- start:84 stop:497 length:414 start_codon:yes stop_codon:yes gene_type:complete
MQDGSNNYNNFNIIVTNESNISYDSKNELLKPFNTNDNGESDYSIILSYNESVEPLIVNTNGTVSKYSVEVTLNFYLQSNSKNITLFEDTVRGFAQYTVTTSEVENNEKRKQTVRSAINDATQIMVTKIQSNISDEK